MKTVRISRQGFSLHGMHSWMRFFIFVLTKKYNVIVDSENPDIVLFSNLFHYKEGEYDTYLKAPSKTFTNNTNKKFIYVSGEVADFGSTINSNSNCWGLGYEKLIHPRYFRMPSCVIDAWTLFDEARIVDTPFNWLVEKRDYDKIIKRQKGFCSITQASESAFRGTIFDKLQEYKQVTSSGPWRQNISPEDAFNKYVWLASEYIGRNDGLTYREKIEFFKKFKFNIAIHYTNTNYIVQEKLFHAFVSGAIPIFYGNQHILEEGFNPNSFINLHSYSDLNVFLEDVKRIDTDTNLHRKYIEEPIFVDNKLPDYFDLDNVLSFLEKIVES